jgi:hypothetical protein
MKSNRRFREIRCDICHSSFSTSLQVVGCDTAACPMSTAEIQVDNVAQASHKPCRLTLFEPFCVGRYNQRNDPVNPVFNFFVNEEVRSAFGASLTCLYTTNNQHNINTRLQALHPAGTGTRCTHSYMQPVREDTPQCNQAE